MSGDEVAFYRAVEDHFARLRGTPFLFTPKDFGLLRRWWEEGVPLAAVIAGIGEAVAKRREREEDPVSSLAYCRHAVARHARRLAVAAVGGVVDNIPVDVPACMRSYVAAVQKAAERWADAPAVVEALTALAGAVMTLPVDAPAAALDATATSLEASALDAAADVLPAGRREALLAAVAAAEDAAGGHAALSVTARRALRLKVVREVLCLPRLELGSDAAQG
jgi:hypothetical protein